MVSQAYVYQPTIVQQAYYRNHQLTHPLVVFELLTVFMAVLPDPKQYRNREFGNNYPYDR